jgi:hypothetical protein
MDLRQSTDLAIDTLKDDVDQKLVAIRTETAELGRKIDKKLETLLVGGVHVEAVGLFWILLGITAATIPEIVYYFWLPVYDLLEVPWP